MQSLYIWRVWFSCLNSTYELMHCFMVLCQNWSLDSQDLFAQHVQVTVLHSTAMQMGHKIWPNSICYPHLLPQYNCHSEFSSWRGKWWYQYIWNSCWWYTFVLKFMFGFYLHLFHTDFSWTINWPCSTDAAQEAPPEMVNTHWVVPVPAYEFNCGLMYPIHYKRKLIKVPVNYTFPSCITLLQINVTSQMEIMFTLLNFILSRSGQSTCLPLYLLARGKSL